MDQSWMYDRVNSNRYGLEDGFVSGVEDFVIKAINRLDFLNDGGIRAHHDVAIELEKKLSRPPNLDELFMVTHKKKNGQWIDRRAENTYVRPSLCLNLISYMCLVFSYCINASILLPYCFHTAFS
ncbi:unnamed protein product [Vicia faba]|uniref:Uncharacterized protein n=1 Tax=Vicia faba TaxID=3906 RepID=A0AAV0YQL2_VICFA|nr:unnamed protein product [Vicia faba]